ncbi:MAG TPA: hypothetical protein VGF55_17665 [Gemmataceae bacterium]
MHDIQRLVASIRQNLDRGRNGPVPGDVQAAAEWVARFRAWAENHPKRDIDFDDSRESIYAGRGE